MKLELDDDEILATPVAEHAAVFFCPNPHCRQPHMLLFDANLVPLAHFVVGDDVFIELAEAIKRKKQQ